MTLPTFELLSRFLELTNPRPQAAAPPRLEFAGQAASDAGGAGPSQASQRAEEAAEEAAEAAPGAPFTTTGRLPPTDRDFHIFREVVIEGRTTRKAASENYLSQTRICQMVKRVRNWLREMFGELPEKPDELHLKLAKRLAADRLDQLYSEAMESWRKSQGEQKIARSVEGQSAVVTIRESQGDGKYLTAAGRLTALKLKLGLEEGILDEAQSRLPEEGDSIDWPAMAWDARVRRAQKEYERWREEQRHGGTGHGTAPDAAEPCGQRPPGRSEPAAEGETPATAFAAETPPDGDCSNSADFTAEPTAEPAQSSAATPVASTPYADTPPAERERLTAISVAVQQGFAACYARAAREAAEAAQATEPPPDAERS